MDQNFLQQLQFPNRRARSAANLTSAALGHGRVVAIFDGSAESDAYAKATDYSYGVEYPDADNVIAGGGFAGVFQAPDTKSVAPQHVGQVVEAGLAQCYVRVPASTNLAIGTMLVPATIWDATNNKTLFTTAASGGTAGALEPLVDPALGVLWPAHPYARLAQALTASGSDTVQLAWVEVLPFRRPLPWQVSWNEPAPTTALTRACLLAARGPGIVLGYRAQAGDYGDTQNTLLDIEIAPYAATPDVQSIFSTTPVLAHDATNGGIFGAGVFRDGDTDGAAFSLGTGGTHGVLKAANLRVFPSRSLVALTVSQVAATSLADLRVDVFGLYF